MPEMRGVTVKIPADLHAEVKAYLEVHGMTMGEFIAQAVDHELHPKIQITQEDKNMERMRTLAFQVPDSLFQRVKAYLGRNHMSQKQFVIGLIEAELEQDEALYQSEQTEEKVEESDENEQTDQAESGPQEAQEGPGAELEEQPAPDQDAATVDDFEAGSEDGEAQPETEEETEEQGEEEILEDSSSAEALEEQDVEEEQEEQSYQPGMAW